MNYYDISNSSIPASKGYKKGLFPHKSLILYRILTAFCSIFTVAMILTITTRADYSSGLLKYCLLIFITTVISLTLLYMASITISAKCTEKLSLTDRHDYNLALYRTQYKRNRKLQAVTLVQMAMQQLLLGNCHMSLQALELVSVDCLSLPYLRNYYLYKAAALYIDGQTGWQACLDNCYAVPAQKNQLGNDEIASAFPSDIIQAIRDHSQIKRKWPAALIITAIVILYTGLYYGAKGLLLPCYNYRYWFETSSTMLISLSIIALSLYWIIKFILFRIQITGRTGALNVLINIVLGIVWFCLAAMLFSYQLIIFFTIDTEVEEYDNGIIYMVSETGYNDKEYYYNIKVGPFLRRSLTYDEFMDYGLNQDSADDFDSSMDTADDASGSYDSTDSTDDASGSYDSTDSTDGASGSYGSTDSTDGTSGSYDSTDSTDDASDDINLFSESQSVYQYLVSIGQLSEIDITTLEHGYTAKGTFYTVFESSESDGRVYENRLVYDRISANGQCNLFVYQQVSDNSDTQILGFYAVNKENNQVYSADRTSWGGISSETYREATGED